jgi:hypothetical protein
MSEGGHEENHRVTTSDVIRGVVALVLHVNMLNVLYIDTLAVLHVGRGLQMPDSGGA